MALIIPLYASSAELCASSPMMPALMERMMSIASLRTILPSGSSVNIFMGKL